MDNVFKYRLHNIENMPYFVAIWVIILKDGHFKLSFFKCIPAIRRLLVQYRDNPKFD